MVILNDGIYNALDKGKIIYLDNINNLTEKNKDFTKSNPYFTVVVDTIYKHIKRYYENANFNNIKKFAEIILNSRHVYVFGAGRSGLMGQLFAEYLVKLGIKSFIYGDVTSPYAMNKDCFIALSGSGETGITLATMNIAKEKGLKILSLTSHINSSIHKLSDVSLIVDGDNNKKKVDEVYLERILSGHYIKITPLGTLFELTLLSVLYAVGIEIASILDKDTVVLDLVNKRSLIENSDYSQITNEQNIIHGKILDINKNMINISLDNDNIIYSSDSEFLKRYNIIKDDFKNFILVVMIESKSIIFSNQILESSLKNQLKGKIVKIAKKEFISSITVEIGNFKIKGVLANDLADILEIRLEKQVYISFKAINVKILDIF
jgi:6-phospho 3-hexuloisomerase